MSKKIRISELAQEINSTNTRVMELLARIGIKVSNASSSLTEEQAEQFYESINFKRGDKSDADNNSGASAADKAAAARAAAAQSARQRMKPIILLVRIFVTSVYEWMFSFIIY